MKNLIYNVVKFMDCYIAPMFINGNKEDDYFERMRKKYPKK